MYKTLYVQCFCDEKKSYIPLYRFIGIFHSLEKIIITYYTIRLINEAAIKRMHVNE